MAEKLVSSLILAHIGTNLIPTFFVWVLPLLNVMNCCKLSLYATSGKTSELNQTRENGKKPSFRIDFGPLSQTWAPKIFSVDFTSTRC